MKEMHHHHPLLPLHPPLPPVNQPQLPREEKVVSREWLWEVQVVEAGFHPPHRDNPSNSHNPNINRLGMRLSITRSSHLPVGC